MSNDKTEWYTGTLARIFLVVCCSLRNVTKVCLLFQGDIQAVYDSIDKETPIGTDKQVSICRDYTVKPV